VRCRWPADECLQWRGIDILVDASDEPSVVKTGYDADVGHTFGSVGSWPKVNIALFDDRVATNYAPNVFVGGGDPGSPRAAYPAEGRVEMSPRQTFCLMRASAANIAAKPSPS